MEKKKLQRIIGILVVVAFVIVLIPLLIGKKDAPPQQVATLTAPPFPEQQSSPATTPEASQDTVAQNNTGNSAVSPISTTDTNNSNAQNTATTSPANTVNPDVQDNDNGITPIASVESDTQSTVPATATPVNPTDANNTLAPSATQARPVAQNTNAISPASAADSTNNIKQQPTTLDSHPNVKYTDNTVEVTPALAESKPAQNTEEITPAVTNTINGAISPQAKVEKTAAVNTSTVKETKPAPIHKSLIAKKAGHFSEKDLANLKKPAWVVQMGSFKNKSNAHRLADQLRAAGFKAFTHEVTSSAGTIRTRVYIGPEFKEASALKLSTQVEQAIKLRGFVVPYKPLAL